MKDLSNVAFVGPQEERVSAVRRNVGHQYRRDRHAFAATHFRISHIVYEPSEIRNQLPCDGVLLRQISGPDRPAYWLAELSKPIRYSHGEITRDFRYLVVTRRYRRDVQPCAGTCVVGLAFVTDTSLLFDDTLDYSKCTTQTVGIIELSDILGRDAD